MIEHWKLDMIVGFWLKGLNLDPEHGVIKEGWGSIDRWKRTVHIKGIPDDGILKRLIGWNRTDNSIEFFTGAVTTLNRSEEGHFGFWSQFESNVNITINQYSMIMHSDSEFKAFSKAEMDKLYEMLMDPDETIAQYWKDHPKYEYDDKMRMIGYTITRRYDRHTEIKFYAPDRILPKEGLYIGFEGTDDGKPRDYVFKVTEKSFCLMPDRDADSVYQAKFHGYFTPTEEQLRDAVFGWVIDKDVIANANNDARLN